ncbi:MAG: phosphate signaling complex protein PhoU [bacterium]
MQRHHFDEKLKELKETLFLMGNTSEKMVDLAIKSLMQKEENLIQEVFLHENEINHFHVEIDELCLNLLALYQPIAADLRFITGGMKINSELERIADLAVNIGQSVSLILKQPQLEPHNNLPKMSLLSMEMVKKSLESFINKDVNLAKSVLLMDNEVDKLKDQIFRELLTLGLSNPQILEQILIIILISRHLERIGDHATNIAEDVIFMVLGKDIRHHVEEVGIK